MGFREVISDRGDALGAGLEAGQSARGVDPPEGDEREVAGRGAEGFEAERRALPGGGEDRREERGGGACLRGEGDVGFGVARDRDPRGRPEPRAGVGDRDRAPPEVDAVRREGAREIKAVVDDERDAGPGRGLAQEGAESVELAAGELRIAELYGHTRADRGGQIGGGAHAIEEDRLGHDVERGDEEDPRGEHGAYSMRAGSGLGARGRSSAPARRRPVVCRSALEVEARGLREAARRVHLEQVAERVGARSVGALRLELLGQVVERLGRLLFAAELGLGLARALKRRQRGRGGEDKCPERERAKADEHGRDRGLASAGVNRYVHGVSSKPEAPDPAWTRLSRSPIPPYCYVPGQGAHPRRDPKGHSYGLPEPRSRRVDPDAWSESDVYRTGVDLYNLGFFWESHEAFEALWRASSDPIQRDFFQGVIQIAAANLKRRMNADGAARALAERGLRRLRGVPSTYMGLDVGSFCARVERSIFEGEGERPPALTLAAPVPAGLLV